MLRAQQRWQSSSQEGLLDFSRSISFFRTISNIFCLPLLVGLHGSTDTTSQKSALEMFWSVTGSLLLYLFFCKRYLHDQLRFFTFIYMCFFSLFLFFSFFSFLLLAFFHDQTHTGTHTIKGGAETWKGRKETLESSSLHSICGLQINVWLGVII